MAVAILLLAALLRFALLAALPAGVSRDEAVNALDEAAISWTNRPVFFWDNSGREALFFYWQHAWALGLGVSPFSLRVAAASLGLLSVALELAVMRRFFGWRTGLLAAAILATMYWAVQDTRIGLRFTMTPVFALLAVVSLHDASRKRTALASLLAGATIGLAANSYTSADALALVGIGWAAYLLARRRVPPETWATGVAIGLAAYVATIAPLGWYLRTNPIIFAHLDDLRAVGRGGGIGATAASVLHNVAAYAWSIAGSGDIQWVQNVSGKPVYDWLLGALCYGGIALLVAKALARAQSSAGYQAHDGAVLCLLVLGATVLPGIVSRDAPYYLRVFGAVPVLAAAPALALDGLWERFAFSAARPLAVALVAAPLVVQTASTAHDFFVTWAQAPDAQLRHGSGPAAIAAYLRGHHPAGTIYVSTNDPEGVRALAPAASASVRWIHADGILPLPASSADRSEYLLDLATPYYEPDRYDLYYPIEGVLRAAGSPVLDATDPNARVPSARGYAVQGLGAFQALIPNGPHARFGQKVELVGAAVEPVASQAGTYRVLLAMRAGDSTMGFAQIGVSAVDDAGAVWGRQFLRALDTSDWRAGQLALSMQSLRLDAGTPPGKLSIDVTVWDDQAKRLLGVDAGGATSVQVGTVDVHVTVPVDATHALPPVTSRHLDLGGALHVQGVQLDQDAPRQNDEQRVAVLWSCDAPLAPGTRLDLEIVDARGSLLGAYAPKGLLAPSPDACRPGVPVLDQRYARIGPRWPAATATLRAVLRDGASREIAAAPLAGMRIQALPRASSAPAVGRPVGARFADGVELVGLTIDRQAASPGLAVDLVWRAGAAPGRDYTAFLHVIGPGGALIAQHDGPPAGGAWPTSFWEPGQVVVDRHVVPLPPAGLGPDALLEVGLYDPTSGVRLRLLDPGAAQAQDEALRLSLGGQP